MRNDCALRCDGKLYQIERQAVVSGLRRANVRIEHRLDGSLAVHHGERNLPVNECVAADQHKARRSAKTAMAQRAPSMRFSGMAESIGPMWSH